MSPPSSSPPGVPSSGGNTKYALVALLLLLGIGGLLAIRAFSSSNKALPPPPLPSSSMAQTLEPPPNPKLDDIPPPPPPEEKPEAGPAGPRVVYAPSGGCESKCNEKYSTPELAQALAVRQSQARRCYNQALARDPSLKGRVSIGVRIGPAGNVCSVGVESNDMGTPAVANCAANIFRNASYPAPKGGCVDANIPLKFVPQGEQQ
jgi:outer membrane biosynthesis protein TonB